MIIINDNYYSNPFDESDDNKTKIIECITKIIKVVVLLLIIIEIIKY